MPWALLAKHEDEIKRRFGRPLEDLARHGGLEVREVVSVLDREQFGSGRNLTVADAEKGLETLLKAEGDAK